MPVYIFEFIAPIPYCAPLSCRCGACIPVHMVTGIDGGYHETGTKTPKISFYETYKDEAGKSRRRVHTHTWQRNLVHKCVQEQAPVIYSVVTGDAIQMQRFSPKQLD